MKTFPQTLFALAVIASLLLAACAPQPAPSQPPEKAAAPAKVAWEEKWASAVAAARNEGKVVIYGQVGPELREGLTSAAKQDLGLELEFVLGKSNEVSTRFMTEWQAGIHGADIFVGGASTFLNDLKPDVVLDKIEPYINRPEATDPAAWRDGKLPFLDSQKKVIPMVLQVFQLLIVNTDSVKPGEIKAYKDLLQPQWKGKITMYDPTIGGTANSWVALILTKAYGAGGEDFLRQFAAQEPLITKDSRQQIEWVARGRYLVTVAVDSQAAYGMHKSGAPITRLSAEEGGILGGAGGYLTLPMNRPHPNATTVMLNWLLGPRGQEVYSKGYGAPAARIGVATEGVSSLALALPAEKLFLQDEQSEVAKIKALDIAKTIFGPLMK